MELHRRHGQLHDTSGTVSDTISKATPRSTVTPYSASYDGNAHTATGTATGIGGVALAAWALRWHDAHECWHLRHRRVELHRRQRQLHDSQRHSERHHQQGNGLDDGDALQRELRRQCAHGDGNGDGHRRSSAIGWACALRHDAHECWRLRIRRVELHRRQRQLHDSQRHSERHHQPRQRPRRGDALQRELRRQSHTATYTHHRCERRDRGHRRHRHVEHDAHQRRHVRHRLLELHGRRQLQQHQASTPITDTIKRRRRRRR